MFHRFIAAIRAGLPGGHKQPVHTGEEIQSVSVSCGHMDYCYGYSFQLKKTENGWLLDAECFTDAEQPRVELQDCPVTGAEAEELLRLIREEQILNKLRRYRKPVHRFHVLDETTYYASISFSDGASVGAPELASKELEAFFYRCAGKYSGAAPDPDGKGPDTGRS